MSFDDLVKGDEFTVLRSGPFMWLLNIHLGYHVSRHGVYCLIEPYMPFCFAHQFGYDQLYDGNANPELCTWSSQFDCARAGFYSVARGTRASFVPPFLHPKFHRSLNFCRWYSTASQASGFELLISFMAHLDRKSRHGEGSVGRPRCLDASIESPDVGVDVSKIEKLMGLDPSPLVDSHHEGLTALDYSRPQLGVSLGSHRPSLLNLKKHRAEVTPQVLWRNGRFRYFRQGLASFPAHLSMPEVIELDEVEEMII